MPTSVKIKKSRIFLRRIARGGIFVAIVATVFWCLIAAIGSRTFEIWNVHFKGNNRVTATALHHLSNLSYGRHLLSVDAKRVSKDIQQHAWIKKATVDIELPSTVHVEIVEHQPAFLVALEKVWYVSDEGIPFKQASAMDLNYPMLTGVPHGWAKEHPNIAVKILADTNQLMLAINASDAIDIDNVSEFHFNKNTGFSLILRNGTRISIGFYEVTQRLFLLQEMINEGLNWDEPKEILLDGDDVAVVMPLSPNGAE